MDTSLTLGALHDFGGLCSPSGGSKDKKDGILIIYTSTDGKETAEVKMLDLTAPFSSAVTVKSDGDITAAGLKRIGASSITASRKKAQRIIRVSDQQHAAAAYQHRL